jgi:manganese/zinc-transporting P-type ATPase C
VRSDEIEVRSATRGRLRLRWAALADGVASREDARARVTAVPGVLSAELYGRTGSLVVRFDPSRTAADLVLAALRVASTNGHVIPPALATNEKARGQPAPATEQRAAPTRRNGREPPTQPTNHAHANESSDAPAPASKPSAATPAEHRHDDISAHHHSHDGGLGGEITRLAIGGVVLLGLVVRRLLPGAAAGAASPRLAALGGVLGLVTGYPFFKGLVRTLTGRQGLDTDTLVAVATLVSILMRESIVALVVLFLLNLGELLQAIVLRRTRRAIRALLVDQGDAWVVVNGVEVRTPVEQLQVGDVIAVYHGDRLPADGAIVEGEGAVNEAPITGESLPAYKRVGDHVWAGTILESGSLRFRARRVGTETAVGRLIQRVEEAEELRAPIATLGERFASRFVPFSFALAGLVFLLTRDARRAMTMLLVACPCAAGLSTPTAVSAAIASAARRGVLIKGGSHLEAAGQIDAVVFDKTGTLTVGQPLVTIVYSLADDVPPEAVLSLAASGEFHSKHPLALAVVRHAEERAIEIPTHEECEIIVGQGVRADLQANRILVGSDRLLHQFGLAVSRRGAGLAAKLSRGGQTPLFVAFNDRVVGVLGIADQLRPESAEALAAVRVAGVRRVVLLTGDSKVVANAIGRQLGLAADEVRARALPEDKFGLVRALQAEGYHVAMVGDGINDAPALAVADVGIAMGTAGSDVAIEAADLALASNDIRQVASVVYLGRHTLEVIRQNYALSIGVNSIGILVGAAGALNPLVAAVLHNLSSLAVLANSARLVRYRDPVLEPRAPRAGRPRRSLAPPRTATAATRRAPDGQRATAPEPARAPRALTARRPDMAFPLGPLALAALGGTAAGIALGRKGRSLLVAGMAQALKLNREAQALAEEARLGLEDIASEARERASDETPGPSK